MKALAVSALPDLCSKSYDNNDDVKLFIVLEERVDVPWGGVELLYLPVFFLVFGNLGTSVNIFPIRHNITRHVQF